MDNCIIVCCLQEYGIENGFYTQVQRECIKILIAYVVFMNNFTQKDIVIV